MSESLIGKIQKNTVSQKNEAAKKELDPMKSIGRLLERMKPEIARALPKHLDPDRLARIVFTTIRLTPKLLNCSQESLLGAVMQAAQLGLEPGLLGHCYIIPYGREAQFIIGYKGMIDLARRSGNITSIAAREVYENDFLEISYGLVDKMEHIPWHLRKDEVQAEAGDLKGCYMIAHFTDGGHYVHYMSRQEIDQHRKRSPSAQSSSSPWKSDYVEMAKKTVVRSGWKWLPISVELAKKVEASDNTIKTEIAEDMSEIPALEVDFTVQDEELEAAEPESDK